MDCDHDFIGFVALSLAGRDKKRNFIVVAQEPNFVYLVDGKTHRLEKPKKKKLRHVRIQKMQSQNVRRLVLNDKGQLKDSDIRMALREMGLF